MSDQRRFRWKSGRLSSGPIQDFWQISRTVQNPAIPNLPLETPAAGGASYTLTADSGSFVLAGTAATLKTARRLTADSESVAVTGSAASLEVGRKLTAEAASVVVSGAAAGLLATRTLIVEAGAVAVSGQNAALKTERALSAESASIEITGTDATLTYTPLQQAFGHGALWDDVPEAPKPYRRPQADQDEEDILAILAAIGPVLSQFEAMEVRP